MIIGIVGSRRRDAVEDFRLVAAAFRHVYTPGDRIVSGGCPRGGDRFAELIAIELAKPAHYNEDALMALGFVRRHHLIKELGAPIHIHPANWAEDGRKAGHLRNSHIAQDADILIACAASNRRGGTEDTVRKFCAKLGVVDDIAQEEPGFPKELILV